MTSLTIVRRIRARPSIVFDALTTQEGIAGWWGPDAGPVLLVETDARSAVAFGFASACLMAPSTRAAANISRW
jgi:uncharacterized protein YndB with AHSA1/START domain